VNWFWRLMVALTLVGFPALWFSATVTDASPELAGAISDARGPLSENINNKDRDELCGSGNPRKQKKCHFNGWDVNANGNDNANQTVLASNTIAPGDVVTVDGLTVELSRTAEPPVLNAPFVVSVKGSGAAIERVSWWVEGPVHQGPFVDDLAFTGMANYDCNGSQSCAWSWPVVARYLGPYMLHARVRDTSGREVQTDWKFDTIEAPRP
jgi:hypothetical protein